MIAPLLAAAIAVGPVIQPPTLAQVWRAPPLPDWDVVLPVAAALTCFSPHVSDGDTIRCAGQRVRLYGIDAPEIRHGRNHPAEPWGYEAADRLHELTRGPVSCVLAGNKHDRYRRAVVRCSGLTPDVGESLVREGLAQRCEKYDRDGHYIAAEEEAREHHRGIWSRGGPAEHGKQMCSLRASHSAPGSAGNRIDGDGARSRGGE